MMYAQLRGNNQGIIKITTGGVDKKPNEGKPVIAYETRLSAIVNGNGSSGMLTLHKATDIALTKCKARGFAIVGTNNTPTSTGALGYDLPSSLVSY